MASDTIKHPVRIFSKEELKREIPRSFPIWLFYLMALGLLGFAVANLDPSHYQSLNYSVWHFAATIVFPLFWVITYYILRIKNSSRIRKKTYYNLVIPALLLAAPGLICLWFVIFPSSRLILPENTLRHLFEWALISWSIVFFLHALIRGGIHRAITFFGIGLIYGLLLENAGIIMGYFHEPNYRIYLGRLPAPLATMMGWSAGFYLCIWIAECFRDHLSWFKKSPLRGALLTTAVALSLDLQLDPLASLSGVFWGWNAALGKWFLSVPFCNYAAWFGAFLPFAWTYFYLRGRKDLSESGRNLRLFLFLPLITVSAGLIWLVLMAIYEGGWGGPTFRILSTFLKRPGC